MSRLQNSNDTNMECCAEYKALLSHGLSIGPVSVATVTAGIVTILVVV